MPAENDGFEAPEAMVNDLIALARFRRDRSSPRSSRAIMTDASYRAPEAGPDPLPRIDTTL